MANIDKWNATHRNMHEISLSIGYAEWDAQKDSSYESLISRADCKMYEVKNAKKNTPDLPCFVPEKPSACGEGRGSRLSGGYAPAMLLLSTGRIRGSCMSSALYIEINTVGIVLLLVILFNRRQTVGSSAAQRQFNMLIFTGMLMLARGCLLLAGRREAVSVRAHRQLHAGKRSFSLCIYCCRISGCCILSML